MIKALGKPGYTINDQKGSHIHLRHPVRRPLTVPKHPEVARETLRIIIKNADLRLNNFWSYYESGSLPLLLFFCNLSLEKVLNALFLEKFNDSPEKTQKIVCGTTEILTWLIQQSSKRQIFQRHNKEKHNPWSVSPHGNVL